MTRRQLLAAGSTGLAAVLLAACSSSGSKGTASKPTVASSAIANKLTKPAELTVWTWVPNISKEVALFSKKYPNIKVNVVIAG